MGSKKSKPVTQTTVQNNDPWVGIQPHLKNYYAKAGAWANDSARNQGYYPGSTVAGTDYWSSRGQNDILNAVYSPTTRNRLENTTQRVQGFMNQDVDGLAQDPQLRLVTQQSRKGIEDLFQDPRMRAIAGQNVNEMRENPYLHDVLNGGIDSALGGPDYRPALQRALSGQVDLAPIQGMIEAAGKNIGNQFNQTVADATSQFNESVLPNIRGDAITAGGYGGSRQQIAQGLSAGKLQQELARQAGMGRDQLARLSANLYGEAMSRAQQLQAQAALQTQNLDEDSRRARVGEVLSGLGLAEQSQNARAGQVMQSLNISEQSRDNRMKQVLAGLGLQEQSRQGRMNSAMQTAGMMPGLINMPMQWGQMVNQIGMQRQGQRQSELDDQVARYNYNRDLPYQNLQRYGYLLTGAGNPGGSSTSTQAQQQSRNVGAGAVGGAMTGASMGSMFGPVGTVVGGGLGLLGGAFGWI